MRFLLDENAEFRIAAFLTGRGHDVTAIAHDYPHALSERRILITNDRDFGELIFREGLPHAGVIYFRLALESPAAEKTEWLRRILEQFPDQLGRFLVVTPRGLRQHP